MSELLLIVTIAGQRAAFRASDVQSVIELDAISPVPRAPAHVVGISALRSRVITVIDCHCSLGLERANDSVAGGQAVVVEYGGHSYALQVDEARDVTESLGEAAPSRTSPGEGWARVSTGVVETAAGPFLLLDTAALIAGPALSAAA